MEFLYVLWVITPCSLVIGKKRFRRKQSLHLYYTGCPTRYRTRHFFNNFTTNEDIATKFETDLTHCVRNVKEKDVLLFKFRCSIFIFVRIIKEMPGSIASGTPCITVWWTVLIMQMQWVATDCTANNAERDVKAKVDSNSLFMFMSLLQECKTEPHKKGMKVLLPGLKPYLQDI
jgi:hypothetical protein